MTQREFLDQELTKADAQCDIDRAHWLAGVLIEAMIEYRLSKPRNPSQHGVHVATLRKALHLLDEAI